MQRCGAADGHAPVQGAPRPRGAHDAPPLLWRGEIGRWYVAGHDRAKLVVSITRGRQLAVETPRLVIQQVRLHLRVCIFLIMSVFYTGVQPSPRDKREPIFDVSEDATLIALAQEDPSTIRVDIAAARRAEGAVKALPSPALRDGRETDVQGFARAIHAAIVAIQKCATPQWPHLPSLTFRPSLWLKPSWSNAV